jgi:hypothetical protein
VGVVLLVFGGPTVHYIDGISVATTAPGGRKGASKFCFEVIMRELINPNRKCAVVVI